MQRSDAAAGRGSAFTLVETLVALGVLSVLLGLLVPALAMARARARAAVSLSNLRGVGVSMELYTQTHKGMWPFHDRRSGYRADPDGKETLWTDDPWALRYAWPTELHEAAPWREHYAAWINPGVLRDKGAPWQWTPPTGAVRMNWPSYEYSNAFVARPEVWGDAPPEEPHEGLLRPTFRYEVQRPSRKALLFDAHVEYWVGSGRPDRRGVLAVDGSAAIRADAKAREPATNWLRKGAPRRYHDTLHGVRGWDF